MFIQTTDEGLKYVELEDGSIVPVLTEKFIDLSQIAEANYQFSYINKFDGTISHAFCKNGGLPDNAGMSRLYVVSLMKSSNNEDEWNDNADTVKAAFNGEYPTFWWEAIMISGVAAETAKKWGGTDKIETRSF